MPRFVLLLHECPGDKPRPTHCDLMFEADDVLATFSLELLPRDWHAIVEAGVVRRATSNTIAVEKLPDHRPAYLDYEGPVSGSRGTVRQLDRGEFVVASASTFCVTGRKLRGEIQITPPTGAEKLWQLTYRPAARLSD